MADLTRLQQNLKARGFLYRYFPTAQEAAAYLNSAIDGVSVGIGGSQTVKELGLYPMLCSHNQVVWHWEGGALTDAMRTDIYLTSANAIAETGELINIDGNSNRVASSVFGHKKVYFIAGINKVTPDFDAALYRARNVAAPKRAQSLGRETPCAARADRCYDCKSPQRVCKSLMVYWGKSGGLEEAEVVVIGQPLGM